MQVTATADHETHPCTDCDLVHIYYPSERITHIFICILIFNMHFKICIVFKIEYFISVHWFKIFCNISKYLSLQCSLLKMATCRRYTVCVIYFHILMCTCWC